MAKCNQLTPLPFKGLKLELRLGQSMSEPCSARKNRSQNVYSADTIVMLHETGIILAPLAELFI